MSVQTDETHRSRARAQDAARVLGELRRRGPLVACSTNIVVTGFTANVLLAVGASPAMVEHPGEAARLAVIADALLVNLGTASTRTAPVARAAVMAAGSAGTPWVLDPVAVGVLPFRTALAARLLEHRPTSIRGNASEVLSLAGISGAEGRGVDSTTTSHDALDAAAGLARRVGTVVAVSGPVDLVTDGATTLEVHTGVEMMTRVTGVGCALGALVAACCAVEPSPLVAAAAATTILTVAAEVAAVGSPGPGTFQVRLLDALHGLDGPTVHAHVG